MSALMVAIKAKPTSPERAKNDANDPKPTSIDLVKLFADTSYSAVAALFVRYAIAAGGDSQSL